MMRVTRTPDATHYDGEGGHAHLHATVSRLTVSRFDRDKSGFLLRCVEVYPDGRAVEYTYGNIDPLGKRMAESAAERWVNGRKIPNKLDWR
jgi:hypothetical protein